jgi:hypothetical protein
VLVANAISGMNFQVIKYVLVGESHETLIFIVHVENAQSLMFGLLAIFLE